MVRASCLICHCSVGNTRYQVFVTEDDPSLTRHLWLCSLYPFFGNPRIRPVSQGKIFLRATNMAYFLQQGVTLPTSGLFFPPFSRSYPG